MPTLVTGFVVGKEPTPFGAIVARPRLLEIEVWESEVAVMIGDGTVCLDVEAATKARDMLNDAIEAVS